MKQTACSGKTGAIASVLAGAIVALLLPNSAYASYPTPEPSAVYGLLFEQAAMWRERNRLDLAAQSLRKILESQPDNTEALFQLGSIELQNQNFDQVRATIARLKQADPTDARAAELERAMAVGQTDEVALAEARRLAAAGVYDRAITAYQRAFRGAPPPFDLAVEYYETLAGSGGGWEEARLRLKALADRSFATSRVKFAYARVLTYNEQTRREGIALLGNLASDPAVGPAAFEAMRQGMLWLSIGPQDRPFFESYLRRFPGDTVMREKLAGMLKPGKQDPLAAAVTEAYRLSDQGLNDQAVARFEAVLQSDPSYVDAIAGIGIVRLRQERYVDARDQLMKAMRLAPDRQSDWAQALDTANFWASYREAVGLRDRGDLAQAEKLVRPLADRTGTGTERAVAQAFLADLLRRQGKQREAEGYYREALSRDSANKDAQAGLYQVLTAQGRDVRSEPLLANIDATTRNRIQSDASQQTAERLRVQAKGLESSAPDRAEALYRQAMQADPSSPWLRYDLAKQLARMSRGTASRDVGSLQESLAIRQADRLREQHNLTAAYDALTPFVTGPSPSVAARLALARIYKDSNFSEEAIQVLDGIMVSHPADADTLQEAVNIAIDLKRYERAEVWLAEAMRLQPQNPRLYMVQARLLRARGDNAGARRALETAQQLNRGSRQSEGASVPFVPGEAVSRQASAVASRSDASVSSLRPDGRTTDADVMAEFDKRMAAGPTSKTADAPVRLEAVSLDRRPPLAVPAVLLAQAPTERSVQVAQNPLVPLRRPGDSGSSSSTGGPSPIGGPSSPSAPGTYGGPAYGGPSSLTPPPVPSTPAGPSSSSGDTDPLSREISRELATLKRDTATVVEAGLGFRGRSGESGFGRLNEVTVPLKGRIPIGNGAMTALVMPVGLDAGSMATDSGTLSRYGTNALLTPANAVAPGALRATGVAVGLGFEWGRLSGDVGSTPLGFPIANVVGGVTWNQPLGTTMNLKLEASRRPVTDSLLSYAGVTDPASGTVWGAVIRNGGESIVSYDDGDLGIFAKFAYGYYTGWNVAANQSYELTAGAYFRPYKDEKSELKVGIAGSYLSYNQNLNGYTLGQGGYFSPQSFYSLIFPVDWTETTGKFKYAAGGAIGVQSSQQNSSPFFPNNYALQNAANIAATANSTQLPVYQSVSNTGLAFGLHLGFEYAVTDRTAIGGKANFDNSYQYDQATILLFLRSAIN